MIIVSGCSWACGEWARGDLEPRVTHAGLSQYLEEHGFSQINLGIPGGSNLNVAHRIDGWLQRHAKETKIQKIFVFQTDYARDHKRVFAEDYDRIEDALSLAHIMIYRFYHRLKEIADTYDCPVYLIGGVSDTLPPDMVKSDFPGVEVACQSMTNLMLNNKPNVDVPVLSWYCAANLDLVETIKEKLPAEKIKELLNLVDQGCNRESQVFSCPEFFWPNGVHPNRIAFEKLFRFLQEKKYL